jgi:hypothetical protein
MPYMQAIPLNKEKNIYFFILFSSSFYFMENCAMPFSSEAWANIMFLSYVVVSFYANISL